MDSVAEGEAQRYFDHAITLRDTILFLRYNKDLGKEPNQVPAKGLGKTLCYWPRNNALFCPPIRSKKEVNCGLLSCIFPRPAPATSFEI